MKKIARVLKNLDLGMWYNYTPLIVIGTFIVLGSFFLFHIFNFQLEGGHIQGFTDIYTWVGISVTAGVFAIIISLSLVAIQFASLEYSHRIMEYYIKGVMFWSTIIVYLSTIIISIVLLANESPTDSPVLPSLVALGSILALILLIPHFLITASYLRPEFIIGKLLRRIDTEYLQSIPTLMGQEDGRINMRADRMLPVVEIVERSLGRGDLATTRESIDLIYNTYVTRAQSLHSFLVERYFLGYLLRIGRRAIAEADEEAALLSIRLIGAIGSKGLAAAIAVDDVVTLGGVALKHDAEAVVQQMIDSLRQIYDETETQNAQDGVLDGYRNLVEYLAAAEKGRLLRHLATSLDSIAQSALQVKHDTGTVTRCLDTLESIGHAATIHKMFDVVLHVAHRLQSLGVSAAAAEHIDIAESTIRSLLRVEQVVPASERDLIAATEFAKGDVEREVNHMRRAAAAKSVRASEAASPVVTGVVAQSSSEIATHNAPPAALESLSDEKRAAAVAESVELSPSRSALTPAIKEPSPGDFSDVWDTQS